MRFAIDHEDSIGKTFFEAIGTDTIPFDTTPESKAFFEYFIRRYDEQETELKN